MKQILNIIFMLLVISTISAQTTTIEGYVFEANNRGYIKEARIAALNAKTEGSVAESFTDEDGKFTIEVPVIDTGYIIVINHKVYFATETYADTKGKKADEKTFVKIEMERKPGYVFDVTVAENMNSRNRNAESVDAVTGTLIEVYNNTTGEEVLVLTDYQSPNFQTVFEQGNHYSIMIRKKGFLAKRMDALVNVDGCILCFNGVNNVTEVMTRGNELGTFLANVEMDRIEVDKIFEIENIYYDYNESYIREDAAKRLGDVVRVLNDNPSITIEMGSHTDSRGRSSYNLALSERRANAAVAYMIEQGIEASRLRGRGYGESRIMNKCTNGVECSAEMHEQNRRTELRITGVREVVQDFIPLKRIIEDEQLLKEISETGIIEVKHGDILPDEIKKDIEEQRKQKISPADKVSEEEVEQMIKEKIEEQKKEKEKEIEVEEEGEGEIEVNGEGEKEEEGEGEGEGEIEVNGEGEKEGEGEGEGGNR